MELRPRIRLLRGREIVLGPGKADLLEAIAGAGTLTGAARSLGMSYMRAWVLVRTMNRCFRKPVVETARGGPLRGAASLTPTGRRALALYRRMEAASRRASASGLGPLLKLIRP